MLETLQQLDDKILLALNGVNCPWLDSFMYLFSGKLTWLLFYMSILAAIYVRFGWRRTIGVAVLIALIIAACDQVCGNFIRHAVERMRPSNLNNPISEWVHIVNNHRGGAYGFPSCHAANGFALAVFISLLMRKRYVTITMLVWAVVTAYSRIVLGVHYPGDLLVGAIIGSLIATAAYYSARAIYRRYPHQPLRYNPFTLRLIVYTFAASTLTFAVLSF